MLLSGTVLLLRARRPVPGSRVRHTPRLHMNADDQLEMTLDGEILGTVPRGGQSRPRGPARHHLADFNDID